MANPPGYASHHWVHSLRVMSCHYPERRVHAPPLGAFLHVEVVVFQLQGVCGICDDRIRSSKIDFVHPDFENLTLAMAERLQAVTLLAKHFALFRHQTDVQVQLNAFKTPGGLAPRLLLGKSPPLGGLGPPRNPGRHFFWPFDFTIDHSQS